MKLIERIKYKLISKKQDLHSIISIHNLMHMPTREELKNVHQLEALKSEYIKTLHTKRYMTSFDLNNNSIEQRVTHITQCLTNLSIQGINIEYRELKKISELVEYQIHIHKQSLFLIEIESLIEDIKIHLVALDEICKEKPFMLYHKKRAIQNSIELMANFKHILESLRRAIILEKEAYLNHTIIQIAEDKEKKESLIEEKEKELLQFANWFIPEKVTQANHVNMDKITFLAFIEKELASYVIYHQLEVEALKQQLYEFSQNGLSKENKPILLEKLEVLRRNLLLFYKFGRDLVQKEDIRQLYELKFNILTFDIIETGFSFKEYDVDEEYKYYQEIVMQIFTEISKRNYLEMVFQEDMNKAISYILEFLKTGNYGFQMVFDSEYVLDDSLFLSLLLTARYGNIEEYFKKTFIPLHRASSYFGIDLCDDGEFDDMVSLATVCEYGQYYSVSEQFYSKELRRKDSIVELYKLYKKHRLMEGNEYCYWPDGLSKCPNFVKEDTPFNTMIQNICQEARGKILVLPKSMTKFNTSLLQDIPLEGIILNEGLRELEGPPLILNSDEVLLPSSLQVIDSFDWAKQVNLVTKIKLDGKEINRVIDLFFYLEHKNGLSKGPAFWKLHHDVTDTALQFAEMPLNKKPILYDIETWLTRLIVCDDFQNEIEVPLSDFSATIYYTPRANYRMQYYRYFIEVLNAEQLHSVQKDLLNYIRKFLNQQKLELDKSKKL